MPPCSRSSRWRRSASTETWVPLWSRVWDSGGPRIWVPCRRGTWILWEHVAALRVRVATTRPSHTRRTCLSTKCPSCPCPFPVLAAGHLLPWAEIRCELMARLAEASLLMAPNIIGEGEAHMDDERAGLDVRVAAQLRQWVDRAQGLVFR